jgi:hypothetical protein
MQSKFVICARIYQFRSVQDSGWFPLGSMTCLVGKNGYGKTTILDALLAITTPGKNTVENSYHYSDRRKPVIAELAVPVIDPISQNRVGILRVQRLRNSVCRYLFAPHPTGTNAAVGANEKQLEVPANEATEASNGATSAAGEPWWMEGLYRFCEEKAGDQDPNHLWNEVGLSEGDTASLCRKSEQWKSESWKTYTGSPEKLVSIVAERGLRGTDGSVLFESALVLIPRIIRIPGRTACGDSASRKELDLAGYAAMNHLRRTEVEPNGNPDPEQILKAFISGCLAEDAASEASSASGSLKGLPNSSMGHLQLWGGNNAPTLNQIIGRFWDKEFQIHIFEKSDSFDVEFQRGKEHPTRPSQLSKGTKWFFGFLSLAISARRDAVCQSNFLSGAKALPRQGSRARSLLEKVKEAVGATPRPHPHRFKAPVLFLLDEPATFMHVELQSRWLELMELFTSCHDDVSKQHPLLGWLAPWFCFATHAPSLVRPDADLVLAVDRLHEQESGADSGPDQYRQTASTIIRCPKADGAYRDRYQKVVACFLRAHSEQVLRVFL